MTDSTKLKLMFGRNSFPEHAQAIWGARLIWPNDFLNDRQDLTSNNDESKEALIVWLNNGAIEKMRNNLANPYEIGMRHEMGHDEEVVIYEDEIGKIIGSPQNSSGYVYVCGWLK